MSENTGGARSANRGGKQTPQGNGDSAALGTLGDEREPTAGKQGACRTDFRSVDGLEVRPTGSQGVDQERIRRAVREILAAVGEDPDRDGLRETPDRIARMYAEVFRGLREDPRRHLTKCFQEKYDEIVLVRDIDFASMCEHHLLPFIGVAHVAYLPNGKVVGLSKLARVVDAVARRPQVQERMTEQIADTVMHELDARGVVVVVEATHTCMTTRGVRKPESICTTSVVRGLFKHNPTSRAEVMTLIGGTKR